MVVELIRNYSNTSASGEDSLQEAWDYVQMQVRRHPRTRLSVSTMGLCA